MNKTFVTAMFVAAGISLSSESAAKDVGFSDVQFFIKTKIIERERPEVYDLEFSFCQIGRDNLNKGECIRLSSCRYNNQEMDAEVAKVKNEEVKTELALLTTSSYQSKILSTQYLPQFLRLLETLSADKECVLVKGIEVKGDRKLYIQMEFPTHKS